MASTTCAFCNRYVHVTVKWAEKIEQPTDWDGDEIVAWETFVQGVATCDNCGRSSMAICTEPQSPDPEESLDWAADNKLAWFPRAGSSPTFADVPVHVAAAAREAHSSASVQNVMAAILMARTVVEATAKEKGIGSGQLWAKIDALHSGGFIREDTKDAAHEIRHFGNDMAHGDIADMPSTDEANEVLALMDEVLNEVFQGPARTARMRAKRRGTK